MQPQELSWRERGRLWLRLGIRLVLTVLVVLLFTLAAPPLVSLLMPFVLALVTVWLLDPVIRWVQRRLRLSRGILSLGLILLMFALAGGLISALIYSIVSELVSLVANWDAIWQSVVPVLQEVEQFFSDLFGRLPAEVGTVANALLTRLVEWVQVSLPNLLRRAGGAAGSFAFSIPSFTVGLIIFVMATYFLAADYPRIRFLFLDRLSGGMRDFLHNVKRTAVVALGGYVKAELILSAGVFVILLLGFTFVGQPYAVLLAFLLAVLDFIPIVGSGTVMIPWAAVDLLSGDLRHAIELMVIWGLIALFRRVAEPKVVGDQTGLSPILSLVSIYVGMRLGGVLGMVLGPVVFLVIINLCKLGVLGGIVADLRLAAGDISALLRSRPAQGPPPPPSP